MIPLDRGRTGHLSSRIVKGTVILGEAQNLTDECVNKGCVVIEAPYSSMAEEAGNKLYSNVVASAVICGLAGAELETLKSIVSGYFGGKDAAVVSGNVKAAEKGFAFGKTLAAGGKIKIEVSKDPGVKNRIFVSGSDALAMGAIAGGCNFISAYPMTPSTGLFTFLAQHAQEFGIVAEQAEDEIAAMNMSLGAWYAGARALATTSGGGYDLMQEGMSLAGMLESPAVVALGMRPGPATGLPTRTEQGDLDLVLHSGHGEFPRIILAPGTLDQGFEMAKSAFDLADRFQMPVFILFDQYFGDSLGCADAFKVNSKPGAKAFVRTSKDYRRYALTSDGISARGIPGFGEGLVVLDSDEHDEEGHITEDLSIRKKMVEKRLKKLEAARKIALLPEHVGSRDASTLVVCWGSNYPIVKESLRRIGKENVAMLHVGQLYPMNPLVGDMLKKAGKRIIVENNYGGQFANLLKRAFGVEFNEKILKYDGLPFSVEDLTGRLKGAI